MIIVSSPFVTSGIPGAFTTGAFELPETVAEWNGIDIAVTVSKEKRVMPATKKSGSSKGKSKIHKVMKEHKQGTLKSGSGQKVKSRKQAVAIALSEARKSGAKIPKKK